MKYLGLDLGTKTLGLAISDKLGIISMPYKVINYVDDDYNTLIPELKKIIDEEKIDELVLGFPKNMDNSIGDRAIKTLEFQKILEDNFNIIVHLQDERLSTMESQKFLISNNVSRKKRKDIIDKMAAQVILSTYLETKKG